MPQRILRDGILTSERVNQLDWEAEVFYRRLMSIADDYGRFSASPAVLRAAMYPLKLEQMREANVSRCLVSCEKAGLVRLYRVGAKQYIQILDFGQKIRTRSKWPEPPEEEACQQSASNCQQPADPVVVGGGVECEVGGGGERKARAPAAPLVSIPSNLDTPEFKAAWSGWIADRRERRKPMTDRAAELALRRLAEWGPERAVAAIEHSIANGWQGIFEPQGGPKAAAKPADFEGTDYSRR